MNLCLPYSTSDTFWIVQIVYPIDYMFFVILSLLFSSFFALFLYILWCKYQNRYIRISAPFPSALASKWNIAGLKYLCVYVYANQYSWQLWLMCNILLSYNHVFILFWFFVLPFTVIIKSKWWSSMWCFTSLYDLTFACLTWTFKMIESMCDEVDNRKRKRVAEIGGSNFIRIYKCYTSHLHFSFFFWSSICRLESIHAFNDKCVNWNWTNHLSFLL